MNPKKSLEDAHNLEWSGDKEGAARAYKFIITEFPGTWEAGTAMIDLRDLAGPEALNGLPIQSPPALSSTRGKPEKSKTVAKAPFLIRKPILAIILAIVAWKAIDWSTTRNLQIELLGATLLNFPSEDRSYRNAEFAFSVKNGGSNKIDVDRLILRHSINDRADSNSNINLTVKTLNPGETASFSVLTNSGVQNVSQVEAALARERKRSISHYFIFRFFSGSFNDRDRIATIRESFRFDTDLH